MEQEQGMQKSASSLSYRSTQGLNIEIVDDKTPYKNTIKSLQAVKWIQCPVQKLTQIYNSLKFDLAEDIQQF